MSRLTKRLMELLWDTDRNIALMTVMVLSSLFLDKNMLISSPTALQLAEVLLPLLDNVRLCAPSHCHWLLPGDLCPVDFQA